MLKILLKLRMALKRKSGPSPSSPRQPFQVVTGPPALADLVLQPHQGDLRVEKVKRSKQNHPERQGDFWNRECNTWRDLKHNISRAFAEHQKNVPAIKPRKAPHSTLHRAL